MTITDLVLILFIAALLAFAIYDQFIMPRRNGPTLLAIPLLRRGRIDSVIFVGLIVILIYNNVTNHVWGSDQFWAEFVQPGRTCKPCVARGMVI